MTQTFKKFLTVFFGMALLIGLAPTVSAAPTGTTTVTGTVLDGDGAPVENLPVELLKWSYDEEWDQHYWNGVANTQTNTSGEYTFEVEEGTDYTVKVTHPDGSYYLGGERYLYDETTSFKSEELTSGTIPEIIVPALGLVTGRVLDHNGEPVAGKTVDLLWVNLYEDATPDWGKQASAETDAAGYYSFLVTLGRDYTVRTTHTKGPIYLGGGNFIGNAEYFKPEELPSWAIPSFTLPNYLPVTGRLLDSDGQPVEDAEVDVFAADYHNGELVFLGNAAGSFTNENGEYSFTAEEGVLHTIFFETYGLGPAVYLGNTAFFSRADSFLPESLTGGVIPDFTLPRVREITGQVLHDSGAPADGVTVRSFELDRAGTPEQASERAHGASTDANGNYTIRVWEGHEYTVGADQLGKTIYLGSTKDILEADNFRPEQLDSWTVPTLVLPAPPQVTGRIVDGEGNPRAGIEVELMRLELSDHTNEVDDAYTIDSTETDANGVYVFDVSEGVPYTILAWLDGHETYLGEHRSVWNVEPFFFEDLDDGSLPDLRLVPRGAMLTVTGLAVDGDGNPYQGSVAVMSRYRSSGPIPLDAEGRYTWSYAEAGVPHTVGTVNEHGLFYLGGASNLDDADHFLPEELAGGEFPVLVVAPQTVQVHEVGGMVVDQHGFKVSAAQLKLLAGNSSAGPFTEVENSSGDSFNWEPEEGWYKVLAEADGVQTETEPFELTTDRTNLVLKLDDYVSTEAKALAKSLTPTLSGKGNVGTKVTMKHGKAPAGFNLERQWLLAGKAIKGQTGLSTTTKASQYNKSLAARVTIQRPATQADPLDPNQKVTFAPLTFTSKTVKVGLGQTSLKVSAKAKKKATGKKKNGTATVNVTVRLPGTAAKSTKGKVTIYVGKKKVKTVAVKKGKAKYTIKKLKAGNQKIKVVYTPPKGYKKVTVTKKVKIKKSK